MTRERAKRKLSAVLSADVKGYSRLMDEDEAGTVDRIKEYRALITGLIQRYRGRVVDSPGDNVLAEFASVVDATECSVKIQEELKQRNAGLPDNLRMEFRIGINLGDVIEEDDRIYGNNVNIAARIESLAESGGVYISGTSYDQVKNRLNLGYEYLGEHSLKNIAEPVRVYRVLMEPGAAGTVVGEKKRTGTRLILAAALALLIVAGGVAGWYFFQRRPVKIEPASLDRMAFPLPDKPSIAVLPFDNLSGNPDQEYIADGLTENIIAALSNISEMFVISGNSTFVYKNKPVKIQQVSEELGVRYVLEGSVQKSGDNIRITAQLIEAVTGHNLWAMRYDRNLKDLFALQDEITLKIIRALAIKLTEGEQAAIRESTENFEAWGYLVKGMSLFERFSLDDNAMARELFKKALSIDPEYSYVWTSLAWTHVIDAWFGFGKSPAESLRQAAELAEKAASFDGNQSELHSLWSAVYLTRKQYEKAVAEGRIAVELGPNNALSHVLFAYVMLFAGNFDEAVLLAERAVRLTPYCPDWYLPILGQAYRQAGRYEEAFATFNKGLDTALKNNGIPVASLIGLVDVCMQLGREKQAREYAAELLKVSPTFSFKYFSNIFPYKNPAHLERILSNLRKAGLQPKPSLQLPDKPSIAVLPFTNMSDESEQEYFSDGLTEDLITDLSKFRGLFVISRNSAFIYKGQPVKPDMVRKELGVHYMLEGSVRKSRDRVRITAQLIDTVTGENLWGERYDRDLKDIFILQDEITQQIVSALGVKIEQMEQDRALRKDTANLNASDYNLRGWWYYRRKTKNDNEQARRMFEKAIEIEPAFAHAHAGLGLTYYEQWARQWSHDPLSLKLAFEMAKKSIALDDTLSAGYSLLSHVYLWKKQPEQAIAAIKRTIELDPNDADGYADLAETLVWTGKSVEAVGLVEKAMRLNPHYPPSYLFTLGFAYYAMERYEEAEAKLKEGLTRNPEHLGTLLVLAAIYSELGRDDEARAQLNEALRVNPQLSLEDLMERLPALPERAVNALRKAGLK